MKLSVIIPSYNGKVLLEKMLPELFKSIKNIPDTQVIVYDNDSNDGTGSWMVNYPQVVLISGTDGNKGFTTAVNTAAQQAKGELLLILNNDCYISANNITKLILFLKENPEYSATQPVVKKPSGEIENIGFVVDLKIGKAFPVTDISDSRIKNKSFLYGLSATCLLIRKKDFNEVGMLDESFHSYLEDVDLAFRLKAKGKKYAPVIEADCIHQHMATSRKMGSYKEQKDFINWIRIILKNYSISMIVSNFFPLALERMRNLNGLLKKLVK